MSEAVLVTDGNQRSALAVVRSLGRAGYPVSVVSDRVPSLAGSSRHAVADLTAPDPLREPDAFAARVRALTTSRGIKIVIPITEASVLALLPHRSTFPDAIILAPELDVFLRVCDKGAVFAAASDLGILIPRECVIGSPDEAGQSLARMEFPVVVKPHRSVVGKADGGEKLTVDYADDAVELTRRLAALPAAAFPVHLQERIEGPGVGVFLMMEHGEVLRSFAHRRLREKPPSGGVSVLRESVELDPELRSRSASLLRRLDWRGVAMVEYKVDRETGQAYLMEINGRFWGSLQLAIDCGVDFPAELVRTALGHPIAPETPYREGRRLRWFLGDVDHLLLRLRRSRRELHLPHTAPGRLRSLMSFLAAPVTSRGEVFRLDDPGPAWREARDWLRAARPAGRRA